ncbi:MAG: AsnC family transcriptional regulator [Paenibacillaceae bacterium]|nr:AsnC family transcriptional regulator [Paenibacillaceae bacterium]
MEESMRRIFSQNRIWQLQLTCVNMETIIIIKQQRNFFWGVDWVMTELKTKVLDILNEDARRKPDLIATMLGAPLAEVEQAIAELEAEKVIIKYAPVVNWSKVEDDKVTALIEVQITPERGRGFDAIAERIYLFPEVKTLYLMSGAYDLLVEVEGRNLKEVALFVSQRLSSIDRVLSTKTHFILKKYKQDGVVFEDHEDDNRLIIAP